MKVLANDISGLTTDLELEIHGAGKVKVTLNPVSMDELLSNSDFISVHVPKGQVIGNKEIEKMKKGVILINTARGGVINETDLLSGLNSGKISGAGLDVFINEPNPDPAILSNSRISLTPHLGASTSEAQERIGTELAERIISYFTSRA
jgi:D-3-phosphoglycerate dehydrogenase